MSGTVTTYVCAQCGAVWTLRTTTAGDSMTIVEFLEARLTEEAEAAASMPDPEKHRRTVDCLRVVCAQIVNHLEANGVTTLTDHPIAAGLLVPAYIWSDHPDHKPTEWFPELSKLDLKR